MSNELIYTKIARKIVHKHEEDITWLYTNKYKDSRTVKVSAELADDVKQEIMNELTAAGCRGHGIHEISRFRYRGGRRMSTIIRIPNQ